MKRKKINKETFKNRVNKFIKKIHFYFFYIKRHPIALVKIPYFFIRLGQKGFLQKIRQREKYLKYLNPSHSPLFILNFFNFFSPQKFFKGIKILFTQGPKSFLKNYILNLTKYQNKYKINNLDLYLKKRKDNCFDIFIFSIIAFDYRIQRPQHFAFEMAKLDHRIFYIENEFLINNNIDNDGFAPYLIKKRAENIYLVKLSSSKNYFIYNQTPSKKDLELMFASIKKLIYDAFVINPIAKIDHPFWGFLKEKLAMPIIYDCMDEQSGFKENSKKILKKENDLIKNSDIVLASSNYLFKKLKKYKPKKLVLLPNGGEFNHFNKALNKKTDIPSDIKNIKKPIIGYYGAIDNWFDDILLKKILSRFKNCNVVLIGRVNNTKVLNLAKKHKNLYLLGEKDYSILPNYLKFFKVALVPFKINKLIKATHPVKIYEYLAQGKPVVSAFLPEIKNLHNFIYLAKNGHEFLEKLSKSLGENDKDLINKRINFAKKNQWQNRIDIFEKIINKSFFPKVSIVILSFFNWQMTKICIDSILNYSFYPNYEIIIVDNNSDQKTKEYLKSLKSPKIKVIFSKKNLGFGGGNNLGMKNISSDSKFIILLNNDTIITSGWVSRLIYYAKNKSIGLVGPVTNSIGNEAKINIQYNENDLLDIFKVSKLYTSSNFGVSFENDRIAAFCWIMRKEIYDKIGGFDERYFPAFFEDDDYCLRIAKKNYKIIITEDVFIHHELGKSSGSNKNIYENKFFIENKKKFEKKWKIKWKPHKYRKNLL